MRDYDAIVIGSGINGLTAAAILAKKGWKVVVIEKAKMAGGAAKSSELTERGFIHDWYSTNIGSFLSGQFYQEYRNDIEKHSFKAVISDKPFANLFPDQTGVGIYQDSEKTNAEFKKLSQHDYKAWEQLKQYFAEISPEILPFMQMEIPSIKAVKQLLQMYRKLKFKKTVELGSFVLQSTREFVDAHYETEKAKAIFTPWAFHLDFAPDITNGAIFSFIEVFSNQQNGMGVAEGGVSNLINSIIAMIQEFGGEVFLEKTVEQIIVKNNEAVGVRLNDKQKIFAKRAVIGNVTPTQLIEKLISQADLPMKYIQKAQNFRYGPGSFMMHLALNRQVDWLAGEEFSDFAYIHIGPYTNDIARTYTAATTGMLPEHPMLIIGQQSAVDPTRAPQGKHTLWVQARVQPAQIKGDMLNKIKQKNWDTIKEKYADRLMGILTEYAPTLEDIVLQRKVFSPLDLENDNPNLVGGDNVGGSHHMFQYYLFRPIPGYSKYDTPIKNLYVCGSSTWPGGGLGGTSGYLVGKKLTQQ